MVDEDPRVTRSKAAVIDATIALLAERGVSDTSVEAIAERSGVAKTTIYRHWPARTDLLVDAVKAVVRPPPDPDTGDVRRDLTILVEGLARALRDTTWTSVLPSLVDAAERDPDLEELHRRFAALRHRTVRAVIVRGIERGELREDCDPNELMALLGGPLFYRRLISHEPVTLAFARRVLDHVLSVYAVRGEERATR